MIIIKHLKNAQIRCSVINFMIQSCINFMMQTVVCHHANVCLSRLMVIFQSRPHYISENQTSTCQTTM